jgi:urease accessory protein UreE
MKNKNYGVTNIDFAREITHEYNEFMKETQLMMDETRRATMISLKKILKLRDGDTIEIQDDDTFRIISAEEIRNG